MTEPAATPPASRRSMLLAGACLVLLTAVFLAAGVWQVRRADYKEAMQASVSAAAEAPPLTAGATPLDAQATHLRRLRARGAWLPERTILLDNKVRDGVVGYEVVTPLHIEGSEIFLLVNRGWIMAPVLRSDLPRIETPSGSVEVAGIARIPNQRFLELGDASAVGPVWQNLTVERFAAWSHLALQPVLLYQEAGTPDGLIRVEAAPEAMGINADRHRGYALTWFSLAAVTVVLGVLAWRKTLKRNHAP